ncbi:MAG: flagellar motor switch protein FliN [Planctomycetota bacterium]
MDSSEEFIDPNAPATDAGADAQQLADQATQQAQQVAQQAGSAGEAPPSPGAVDMPHFEPLSKGEIVSGIDLLKDVDLDVKIELGRNRMLVEDVLRLGEGSVVELDKLAGDPVDVFVNDRLVARGEVLVLNDDFCVRVNEILATPGNEAD